MIHLETGSSNPPPTHRPQATGWRERRSGKENKGSERRQRPDVRGLKEDRRGRPEGPDRRNNALTGQGQRYGRTSHVFVVQPTNTMERHYLSIPQGNSLNWRNTIREDY